MTIQEIVLAVSQGGLIPFLIVILWTGMKKYWVFGWYARDCEKRENEWKQAALQGTFVAQRAVNAAETVIEIAGKGEANHED